MSLNTDFNIATNEAQPPNTAGKMSAVASGENERA